MEKPVTWASGSNSLRTARHACGFPVSQMHHLNQIMEKYQINPNGRAFCRRTGLPLSEIAPLRETHTQKAKEPFQVQRG